MFQRLVYYINHSRFSRIDKSWLQYFLNLLQIKIKRKKKKKEKDIFSRSTRWTQHARKAFDDEVASITIVPIDYNARSVISAAYENNAYVFVIWSWAVTGEGISPLTPQQQIASFPYSYWQPCDRLPPFSKSTAISACDDAANYLLTKTAVLLFTEAATRHNIGRYRYRPSSVIEETFRPLYRHCFNLFSIILIHPRLVMPCILLFMWKRIFLVSKIKRCVTQEAVIG